MATESESETSTVMKKLDDINETNLDKVIKSFKRTKMAAPDKLSKDDILKAPPDAKKEQLKIMKDVASQLAWPAKAMLVYMPRLAKGSFDSRALALCSTFYRSLMALTAIPVREWDTEVADDLDTAAAGKSVERAITKRQLHASIASRQGTAPTISTGSRTTRLSRRTPSKVSQFDPSPLDFRSTEAQEF